MSKSGSEKQASTSRIRGRGRKGSSRGKEVEPEEEEAQEAKEAFQVWEVKDLVAEQENVEEETPVNKNKNFAVVPFKLRHII